MRNCSAKRPEVSSSRGLLWAALAVAGVALLAALGWSAREKFLSGANDFTNFYAAGRLAGTMELYRPAAVARELAGVSIVTEPALHHFVRPPWVAAFFLLPARLPYRAAYFAWQALALAAAVAFLYLWEAGPRSGAVLAAAWSFPLMMSILSGQEVAFLLLWVAVTLRLLRRERPFAAGAVLSLCSAKFHLFLLVPLLIVGQKRWRVGAGLVAGGAVLVAASFALQGPAWPQEYLRVVLRPDPHPRVTWMPNLHGLTETLGSGGWLHGLLAAGVVWGAWRIIRRQGFERALAATLVGGLLVSYHCYVADFALCLPACLVVLALPGSLLTRGLALALLTPFPYLAGGAPGQAGNAVVPVLATLLVLSLVREAWSAGRRSSDVLPGLGLPWRCEPETRAARNHS